MDEHNSSSSWCQLENCSSGLMTAASKTALSVSPSPAASPLPAVHRNASHCSVPFCVHVLHFTIKDSR